MVKEVASKTGDDAGDGNYNLQQFWHSRLLL